MRSASTDDSSQDQTSYTGTDRGHGVYSGTMFSGSGTERFSRVSRTEKDSYDKGEDTSESSRASSHDWSIEEGTVIFESWTQCTEIIEVLICAVVATFAIHAARNPKTYVVSIAIISLALISTGYFTNFNVNVDEQVIYAPFDSFPERHQNWILEESQFPDDGRPITLIVHASGENVVGLEQLERNFIALNTIQESPGYHELCASGEFTNFYDYTKTCQTYGVSRFWNHNKALFDQDLQAGTDVIEKMSGIEFSSGAPVDRGLMLGKSQEDEDGTLTYAEAYLTFISLPSTNEEEAMEVEGHIVERLWALQRAWEAEVDNNVRVEFFVQRSYSDEFTRAIDRDLPLVPLTFIIMAAFTCLTFYRTDSVQSRSMLGIGAVTSISFSLMTGYGLLFIIGVPFTSMTQILPFIIFGVGLDDTFIISGAYARTDPKKDVVQRILETMDEVGMSITVTTLTTMSAFALGCISTIPSIFWLNLYAFPTIFINFFYQITFFVALLVLDERRIKARKRDCCLCLTVPEETDEGVKGDAGDETGTKDKKRASEQTTNFADRFMIWYGKQLLRPCVKVLVILAFGSYFGYAVHRTMMMTQEFDFADLVPDDSYIKGFLAALDSYTGRIVGVGIYFRGVDQFDEGVLEQMNDYVDALADLDQFSEPPFCWFKDFENFKTDDRFSIVSNLTLPEQVNFAFQFPAIQELYGQHIVRDDDGAIIASRCWTYVDVNLKLVSAQIEALEDQRKVTEEQPMNEGQTDWPFFTFDGLYFIWEFYAIAVRELIFTTISGVVAVCAVSFFFIPHWTAFFFVFPMIGTLYIDLLGTLQLFGLHINAVTYVCLVISIGLLVDFIVHILLRYYESPGATRTEKVQETLKTMGASILLGGLSTFLGVIPLLLSTSAVMGAVSICFMAMVVLGVTHGLILLPVILSLMGPLYIMERQDDSSEKGLFDTESDASVVGDNTDLVKNQAENVETKSTRFADGTNKTEGGGKSLKDLDSLLQRHEDMSQITGLREYSVMQNTSTSDSSSSIKQSRTFREESLEVVYRSYTTGPI